MKMRFKQVTLPSLLAAIALNAARSTDDWPFNDDIYSIPVEFFFTGHLWYFDPSSFCSAFSLPEDDCAFHVHTFLLFN